LSQQREDGFIPHMIRPAGHSDITQPPVLAWAVERCFHRTGDTKMLEPALPRLKAYLDWNLNNRDSNGNLLCEWYIQGDPGCRSDESGMDNSQRFDSALPMDAVDFACFMQNEYACIARMQEALGRVAEAAESLALSRNIADAVNELLWNDALGIYTDRMMDGSLSGVMAVSGFLPLWAGIATQDRAERMAAHLAGAFATPLPIPSVAASDSRFSTDMWRGSVWMNYNYMVVLGLKRYGMHALADAIAKKCVDSMARWYEQCGSLYEFYHAGDRIPPQSLDRHGRSTPPFDIRRKIFPIADYGWTAAVYIAMLLEGLYPASA